MKLWLLIVMMSCAVAVSGCKHSADTSAAKQRATPAHHEACRKADFDHAAFRVCAVADEDTYYCLYCVDQRGVMWPFEDKAE